MKRVILGLGIIVGLVMLVMGGLFLAMTSQLKAYEEQGFLMDIGQIPDGSYHGEAKALMVGAEVEVVVKDHRIDHVKLLKHNHGRGEVAEALIELLAGREDLAVDEISGASASSTIIKAAVWNALKSGSGQ